MEDIVKEFKEILKSKSSDICSMYHHLFSIFPEKELKENLEYWLSHYQENKEDWFYDFHKSIRQTDFFNLTLHRYVNKLTEEQSNRRQELSNIRQKQYRQEFKTQNPEEKMEDYRIFNQRPDRVESLKELTKLNSILRTEEEFRISGHLDMLLWNTIHLDKDNELQSILERTFKICS
jgi:hypothetical protein